MSTSNLFIGRFRFHLHTVFTDGRITIEQYFQYGEERSLDRLIFLEHVRRRPLYDVAEFINKIRRCAQYSPVRATIGFEAKILPDGQLDIDMAELQQAEVIGIAEHSFPGDEELLSKALRNAFMHYPAAYPHVKWVWVHPGLWFRKHHIQDSLRCSLLIQSAIDAGILIERNLRYDLVSAEVAKTVPLAQQIIGVDAHTMEDLDRE